MEAVISGRGSTPVYEMSYLWLAVLVSLATRACSLQCYCHFDPGESGLINSCLRKNSTCTSSNACFYFRHQKRLPNGTTTVIAEYGCLHTSSVVEVEDIPSNCTELNTPVALYQCCFTDLCNRKFTSRLTSEMTDATTTPIPTSAAPTQVPVNAAQVAGATIGVLLLVVVVVVILCGVAGFLVYRRRWRKHSSTSLSEKDNGRMTMAEIEDDLEITMSSGSGGGKPFLQQRTIAKEIELKEEIGAGRFGRVYRGIWRGDDYAVKTFHSSDEKSWMRETEIYNQVLLPNENILSYLAGDIISNRNVTQMWLIAQYHPKGSLFDFLQHCEPLSSDEAITLAVSAASGLVHLHTEIQGAQRKPAIAHRDIKSKNILVKSNGTCCIADFGMAVVQEIKDKKVNMPSNPRVGTKRYMAPEILDESLDMNHFESFMKVDMYAFALVLWEICLRWKTDGQACSYEVPFSGLVQADPSFDEMKEVVVIKRMRPSIHNQWKSDEVLWSVSQIITECWHSNPEVRLTALRVKKNLNRAISNSHEKAHSVI